jgi:hypothetical protein
LINPSHPGQAIHEITPKSQCPKDWNESSNRVLLCSKCHDQIHKDGASVWKDKLTKLRQEWIEKYAD